MPNQLNTPLPQPNKLIILLVGAICLLSISTVYAKSLYTQASIANLRSEPDSSADIVAKLPIGTFVTYDKDGEQWLKVTVPMGTKSIDGWLHRDILDEDKPSLAGLTDKIQQLAPEDFSGRLKWLERAAAIAPNHTPILDDLANTLETLGQKKKASQVRREIERLNKRAGSQDFLTLDEREDLKQFGWSQDFNDCKRSKDGKCQCKRGLDGVCKTLYYAPDSFHDQHLSVANVPSTLSCRKAFIDIYNAHNKLMKDSQGMALGTLTLTVPADKKPGCVEFENNLYFLQVDQRLNKAKWSIQNYLPFNLKVKVRTDDFCGNLDHIVEVDLDHLYGGGFYTLIARTQSIPTTRESFPYFEVPLKQDKNPKIRAGELQANTLVTKIWTEVTTQDNWTGEPGAQGTTVRTNEALYITRPDNNKPQKIFNEHGLGHYSYSDASIESLTIADINGDDLPDIIITAVNTGQNLLVSTGTTLNGEIIYETHMLKNPNWPSVAGC